MTSTETDLDDLVAQYRKRAISRFDPAALLWLAALPEWTRPLARRVGFPPNADLDDLLTRLDAAGLLARRDDIDDDGEPVETFWLPASRRIEVGAVLRGTTSSVPAMAEILTQLAGAVRALPHAEVRELRPWLDVIEHHRYDPSGASLLSAVETAVSEERTVEALALVDAAQALADLVGEPLTSAARRARWRIDRSYRDALDARALQHYLPRPDIDAALVELVTGRGSGWALHLLGEGGVGKTMTVRDLKSGFARRVGLPPFPVARVDFDHLDPRYPEGRPAELLLALSGELRRHSVSRTTDYWTRRTSDSIIAFNESAPGAAGPRHDMLLEDAVSAFAGQIDAFGGPVVLVLDTCEELAKLHPPGGRAPAVDRTFDLLERLHALAPGLRVVLAGRRWLVPPQGGNAGGLVLDRRPYLRVIPLGGFTAAQADTYLDRRDPAAVLRPALRTALLARSGGPDDVNPFDLACYCDWALAEPDLDPAALQAAGADPYVEQRIIARLPTDEVREALPAAVELGRFDRALLGIELDRRGIDVDAALSGLVSQEWVAAVTFADDGRPAVLEVDERLRPRLHAVLAARPDSFPLERARLGRDLAQHVLTRPLDDPAISAVDTALRLLTVDEAGRLWARLEQRIAATADGWSWADQLTARVAVAEAERSRARHPTILGAIRATQAACVSRRPGAPGAAALWQDVARYAGRHPDPQTGAQLELRALCALVALGPGADVATVRRVADLWPPRGCTRPEDAMVGLLDALTARGEPVPPVLAPILDELCTAEDHRVAATALLARAAGCFARNDRRAADGDVEHALRVVDTLSSPGDDRARVDWTPVPRLRDRARLARVVLATAFQERADHLRLQQWRDAALAHTDDIDAERLVAATITHELCWRPVEPAVLADAIRNETYRPDRQPTHRWHREVPTLCQAVAAGVAANGDITAAAMGLLGRREEAVRAAADPATIAGCSAQLVTLSRASRNTTLTHDIRRAALDGDDDERLDAWATLVLSTGESPAAPEEAGSWSTWFRTQAVRSGDTSVLATVVTRAEADDLDRRELELLRDPASPPGPALRAARDAARQAVGRRLVVRRGRCAELGVMLRADALGGCPDDGEPLLPELPPRVVAETALAEAELLALRLPAAALCLLELARRNAATAGDHVLLARAATLLVLTRWRAHVPLASGDVSGVGVVTSDTAEGWADRRRVALALLEDRPVDRLVTGNSASPELDVRRAETTDRRSLSCPCGSGRPYKHCHGAPAASVPAGGSSPPDWASPPPSPGEASPPGALPRRARGSRGRVVGGVAAAVVIAASVAVGYRACSPSSSEVAPPAPVATATPTTAVNALGPTPTAGPGGATLSPGVPGGAGNASGPASPSSGATATAPATPTTPPLSTTPSSTAPSSDDNGAWLGALAILALIVGGVAGIRFVTRRGRDFIRRPRVSRRSVAVGPGSGGPSRIDCRLHTTPDALTVSFTPTSGTVRATRSGYLFVPVLGQRRGATASVGDQQRAIFDIAAPAGATVLLVRFRPNRLPVTWRLWDPPPDDVLRFDYYGPPALAGTTIADPPTFPSGPTPVRALLHLVGTPVSTAAGWRLRIDTGTAATADAASGRASGAGEFLVGPDDIRPERTALVVLQADPVDTGPRPLRELYEGMWALATDVRDAGAGAVLVVPPLPDALARDVVARIRAAMARRRHRTHPVHVLDLIHDVHTTVADSSPDGRAAADDVQLFA